MSPPMRFFRPDFRTIFKNLSLNKRERLSYRLDTTYDTITEQVDNESLDETDTATLVRKYMSRMVEQPEECFQVIMNAIWSLPQHHYTLFNSTNVLSPVSIPKANPNVQTSIQVNATNAAAQPSNSDSVSPLTSNPGEKHRSRRNITSLYPMPSGRKLRRVPAMTELSSPGSQTIVLVPLEPPIHPLVRTFTRPMRHRKPGASSNNSNSDAASGIEIASASSTQPLVSAQNPDSSKNSKKRSRDDRDHDARPTPRLCIEAPPGSSSPTEDNTAHDFAPICTSSSKGEGGNDNYSPKKRSHDIEEDEEEVARHSPKRRQEPPTVCPLRYTSPKPSDRRIGRIIAPFRKSFRFNPRSPSPEAGNGPLVAARNEGNSADNSMASPSGASTEASRKE